MAKVTTLDFGRVTAEVRTWPAKDREKLVKLIEEWNQEAKPKATTRKPKPTGAAPTETDAVVKKMRLRTGDGTVAGQG